MSCDNNTCDLVNTCTLTCFDCDEYEMTQEEYQKHREEHHDVDNEVWQDHLREVL